MGRGSWSSEELLSIYKLSDSNQQMRFLRIDPLSIFYGLVTPLTAPVPPERGQESSGGAAKYILAALYNLMRRTFPLAT